MSRAIIDVVIIVGGSGDHDGSARRRSEQSPRALVVDIRYGWMARGGAQVEIKSHLARFALALASRPHAIVSAEEITEFLWGDRADGGPDRTDRLLIAYWPMVQAALVALGYAAVRHFGRGFSAWPVESWQMENAGEACFEGDVIPRFLECNA
jgi:hypothetical protein